MKPKRIFALLCILCIIPCVASCSKENETSIPFPANNKVTDANEIVDSGSYFTLNKKGSLYYYEVYDANGNVIVSSDPQPQYPDIEMVDDVLIRITTQGGTGIGTQISYFCNIETGKKSEDFGSVFDQCNNLVAYAQSDKLIVKSIFDDYFYREIVDFQYPFSPAAFPFEDAQFINDGHGVRITYFTGADYETVSEEFML